MKPLKPSTMKTINHEKLKSESQRGHLYVIRGEEMLKLKIPAIVSSKIKRSIMLKILLTLWSDLKY